MAALETVPPNEAVLLGAEDSLLFSRLFFPKAVRQESPPFHREMWGVLENPKHRLVNIRAFRGSAKTTIFRLFAAKRIAYGISRTILYIGASESHAIRSIQWLRGALQKGNDPTTFARTFQLEPGKKWSDTEIEIVNNAFGTSSWVLGVGITGNIRGINFDDYRPDLIICDDPITDENAATKEQRQKITNLLLGAVKESLSPRSEEPNAKLAMLQTPLDPEDASMLAEQSSEWHTRVFSCWTPETVDLPTEWQESSWPQRWPSEELRQKKLAAIADNSYSIWARENEVKLITSESAAFRPEWLQFFDDTPEGLQTIVTIDPVPPPSEREIARDLHGKDFEVITVLGRARGNYYILQQELRRGHQPDWTASTVLSLAKQWRAMRIVVEATAYQKVLEWILRKEMEKTGVYFMVESFKDRRPKYNRIMSTISGVASHGKLFVRRSMDSFISQFTHYPKVAHDDALDGVSIGLSTFVSPMLDYGEAGVNEDEFEDLPELKRAP